MRTLRNNEIYSIAGGLVTWEDSVNAMSDAGWTGNGIIRLERQVINGQSSPDFTVTFADGAVGTLAGAAARGLLGEMAAGFAIGAAITIAPGVLVGIGVAGALIGLATAWALANSHQKIPLTAEP